MASKLGGRKGKLRLRGPKLLSLDANVIADNVPVETIRGVWIGSIHTAFNKDFLGDNAVTHIMNLSNSPSSFPDLFCYLTLTLRDKDASNLLCCVPASNIFIESALQGLQNVANPRGGVLVHCTGGRSRSAAMIIAYMMSTHGQEYDEAMRFLRTKRPVCKVRRRTTFGKRSRTPRLMTPGVIVMSTQRSRHTSPGQASPVPFAMRASEAIVAHSPSSTW